MSHPFPQQRPLAELKQVLPPDVFAITQQKGTEPPFSGKYYQHHETGVYHCVCCNAPLFTSDAKYESGSGWPSFYQPVSPDAMHHSVDQSYGMRRTELQCAACGAHLGHVFEDGPEPTGLRYCINSASLEFKTAEKTD